MPLTLLDNSESLEEVNIRFNNFIFTGIPLKCKLIGLSPEEQKELFWNFKILIQQLINDY